MTTSHTDAAVWAEVQYDLRAYASHTGHVWNMTTRHTDAVFWATVKYD